MAQLQKQKVTVTNVAVATTELPFGMGDYTVDSDVDTSDFSLVLGILHVCGHVHVRSQASPGVDC